MPKCSQCDRPAMYMIGDHPLCLQCNAIHQNILDRQLAAIERQQQQALDDMEMATGVRLPGRRRPQPQPVIVAGSTFHSINIRDSNVGVANTGQLHQVDTAVSVIGRQGEPKLAGALKALTEAVIASTMMAATSKQETVEILSTLASEATVPAAQRRGGVARILVARLRELLSVAADLAQVSQVAVPLIAAAFGAG
jgi:hypothetical protein